MTDRPLAPARIDERLKAGAIDSLVLGLLIALYFGAPLLMGGLTLPMWGVFAAVVGYAVAPLALFRATPGMRLFGIEMVDRNGRNPAVTDLLFRELIGRGYFPIAYLGTLFAGFMAMVLGIGRFALPVGFGFVLFVLSIGLLFISTLGQFFALARPDRRTLADLVAKTTVVPRSPPQPLPEDPDDRAEALQRRRGRLRALVIAEVLLLLAGGGLPWLLTRPTPGESSESYAERLKRQKLEHQFQADPGNAKLANELAWSFRNAGEKEEAERVLTRYRQALGEKNRARETALREQLAKAPADGQNAGALIELLEAQHRTDDARAVYQGWVDADPRPARRAGLGIWLYQSGFSEAAVQELTRAIEEGFESADTVAYRGFAHRDLKKPDLARADFERALELDPSLHEVESALATLP